MMQVDERSETLEEVIQFHGHLCPGLAIGYRVALAARKRLGGERALDEELVAIVENDSCAVDAIQVILGCTFGKGNLRFKDYGKHVYTFFHRDRKGPALRIRRKRSSQREQLTREKWTRQLLEFPEEEVLEIEEIDAPPPPLARIEPSRTCARCDEEAMESRLRLRDGDLICIPCWNEAHGRFTP